jgi:hypothetical protein
MAPPIGGWFSEADRSRYDKLANLAAYFILLLHDEKWFGAIRNAATQHDINIARHVSCL